MIYLQHVPVLTGQCALFISAINDEQLGRIVTGTALRLVRATALDFS